MAKARIQTKIKTRVERVEGTNKDSDKLRIEKYHKDAQGNLEGTTRVTRQEQAKKISGNDSGDSKSIRSIEDAKKVDPSLASRIKNMVKRW